jgi:uncharacterized protein YqhQ
MMRSPNSYAAVVRRRTGALVVREEEMIDTRTGFRGYPLVRGVVTLVEALKLGSRCLRFSADLYEQDLEEEEKEKENAKKPAAPKTPSTLALLSMPIIALATQDTDGAPGPQDDRGKKFFTLVSILFALALFVALPQAFAEGTSRVFSLDLDVRSVGFQVLTGIAKLTIVVGYMMAIRRLPEIYRVFQYHGAEHKAIYTYERGEELTLENARGKTTLHPRCGTTFLVMVAMVSIVVFSAAGPLLPQIGLGKLADNVAFFLIKLPFLPVIAAITFEMQRFLARRSDGALRFLLAPGFLVQRITTIEPEDSQLEVALAALRATLRREVGESPLAASGEATFEGFDALASKTPASA